MSLYGEDELDPYAEELAALEAEQFQPGQFRGSLLENFSGLEQQPRRAPQSFGEGFLGGLTGQVGRSGSRALQRRQQFEESEAQRKAAFDRERIATSRLLRTQSGAERRLREGDKLRTKREEDKAKAEFDAKHIKATPELLEDMPWLKRRGIKAGDPVPKDEVYKAPPKAEKTLAEIEAEATARARGGRAGAPPLATSGLKPSTGEQKKAFGYYQLATQAEDTITATDTNKINPGKVIAAIELPFGMGQAGLNASERAYLQALRQFTEARLRPASGAVINKDEYTKDFQTFFKQPGDTKEDIDRKARSRAVIADNLKFQSGPATSEYYGEEPGSARGRTRSYPTPQARRAAEGQRVSDVKATALRFLQSGDTDAFDGMLEANPDLNDDPDVEAALDAMGVPRYGR